jgi:hypothetical protein
MVARILARSPDLSVPYILRLCFWISGDPRKLCRTLLLASRSPRAMHKEDANEQDSKASLDKVEAEVTKAERQFLSAILELVII